MATDCRLPDKRSSDASQLQCMCPFWSTAEPLHVLFASSSTCLHGTTAHSYDVTDAGAPGDGCSVATVLERYRLLHDHANRCPSDYLHDKSRFSDPSDFEYQLPDLIVHTPYVYRLKRPFYDLDENNWWSPRQQWTACDAAECAVSIAQHRSASTAPTSLRRSPAGDICSCNHV